jgi:uncharacterized C2H2 Zn-finger protein
MVEYICEKCGKIWNRKNDYKRHINKKLACDNHGMTIDKYDLLVKELEKMRINNTQELEEMKKLNIELFKKVDDLEKKNNDLELSISKINKTITNTHNTIGTLNNGTINNNNISINISTVALGKEDLTFIDDNTSKKILNRGFNSMQELIRTIHFNKDKPEYHNIYMPNWRDNSKILVFDGEQWNLINKDDIIDDLKDKGIEFIQKKFDELDPTDKKDAVLIKKIKKFLESYDNENTKEMDKDLSLLLYNGKKMVEKTRKIKK